jgi:hypothetical protein
MRQRLLRMRNTAFLHEAERCFHGFQGALSQRKQKAPEHRSGAFQANLLESGPGDVRGLLALRALDDIELHLLTFLEGLESLHGDSGKVREHVGATIIGSDKTKTLGFIEPLHSTSCH